MSERLRVVVSGIAFKNPVMPAAGPNVRTGELMLKAAAGGAGGIVSKTVSLRPAVDPRPTIRRASNRGLMNCETWSEMPADTFVDECRQAKSAGLPLIVSIGYGPEEVSHLGRWFEREVEPAAFEFSTHYTGRSVEPLLEVARALRSSVSVPIFMKVSPNFPDLEELGCAAASLVDGFVAINSYGPIIDFDVEDGEPVLGSDGGFGWMSGPPILPVALRAVYQLASVQDKPVIGVGGIEKGVDALKFFMVGASAVQVCSAAIKDGHRVYGKIAQEMDDWLAAHGYSSLEAIKGLYRRRLSERRAFTKRPVMAIDEIACIGCRACLGRCVQGALDFDEDKQVARVKQENCIGCGFCQDYCPNGAMGLIESRRSDK